MLNSGKLYSQYHWCPIIFTESILEKLKISEEYNIFNDGSPRYIKTETGATVQIISKANQWLNNWFQCLLCSLPQIKIKTLIAIIDSI